MCLLHKNFVQHAHWLTGAYASDVNTASESFIKDRVVDLYVVTDALFCFFFGWFNDGILMTALKCELQSESSTVSEITTIIRMYEIKFKSLKS